MKARPCLLLLAWLSGAAHLFPQTALDFYNKGARELENRDWYAASESFHEAVRLNPVFGDAWAALAESAYELGEYDLALSCLDEAEKYARTKTAIQNLRGFTLLSLGKFTEAEAVFNGVLAQYPNDISSRFGLAELNIFFGRVSGAESLFLDALKRDSSNRRALLSLALVSSELGKNAAAGRFMDQALRFHSGDAETHYFAAYLFAKERRLTDAEKHARIAVQFSPGDDRSYELLGSILFRQAKYQDALDICEFRINRQRAAKSAWYLKALALQNMGRAEDALQAFDSLLAMDPGDEIARSALETLVRDSLPIEDPRRAAWAAYHTAKAESARRSYLTAAALHEYRQALRIDPQNAQARTQYAQLLLDSGYPASYLNQIEFASRGRELSTPEKDAIEAYRSILGDTLAARRQIDPFYLDKERWRLALFYADNVQLIHEEAGEITAKAVAEFFASVPAITVTAPGGFSSFAACFREARDSGQDYFAVTSFEENERELALSAVIYSGRTGAEAAKIRVFRTGNDRFASAVRRFAAEIQALFPERGKIVAREGSAVLIDLGKIDGAAEGRVYTVIKKGALTGADKGFGLKYAPDDALGTLTVTRTDEELSEGVLSKTGFYDRVNVGDEVIVAPGAPAPPADDAPAQPADAQQAEAPARRPGFPGLGRRREEPPQEANEQPLPDGRTALKPPALAELIRGIR